MMYALFLTKCLLYHNIAMLIFVNFTVSVLIFISKVQMPLLLSNLTTATQSIKLSDTFLEKSL